jgi:hypothetical protein
MGSASRFALLRRCRCCCCFCCCIGTRICTHSATRSVIRWIHRCCCCRCRGGARVRDSVVCMVAAPCAIIMGVPSTPTGCRGSSGSGGRSRSSKSYPVGLDAAGPPGGRAARSGYDVPVGIGGSCSDGRRRRRARRCSVGRLLRQLHLLLLLLQRLTWLPFGLVPVVDISHWNGTVFFTGGAGAGAGKALEECVRTCRWPLLFTFLLLLMIHSLPLGLLAVPVPDPSGDWM